MQEGIKENPYLILFYILLQAFCMEVKKQQLKLDMEQQIGSK